MNAAQTQSPDSSLLLPVVTRTRVIMMKLALVSTVIAVAQMLVNAMPFEKLAVRTIKSVQIQYTTSTKNEEFPLADEPIMMESAGKEFAATTDERGIAGFSTVPCGETVKVTFKGTPTRTFERELPCENQSIGWKYSFNGFVELTSPDAIEQVK